jgi:ribosome-associated protein
VDAAARKGATLSSQQRNACRRERRRPCVVPYNQERVLKEANVQPTVDTEVPTWLVAVRAAESKKATDIVVLDLTGITSFADYFVICTGSNSRQIQAVSDEVGLRLKQDAGELPISVEGYTQAEWILADYGDMLIHIFSQKAREYYDLERLWRGAKALDIPAE